MWSPQACNHFQSEDTVRVIAAIMTQARLPREFAKLPEPTWALTIDAPFTGGLKPGTNLLFLISSFGCCSCAILGGFLIGSSEAAAMMSSEDDDVEPRLKAVENYYFVDDDDSPVSFDVLPFQFNAAEEVPSFKRDVYLRGFADGGLQKVYKQVVAWKLGLEGDLPEITVLSTEGSWIVLLKPRSSYKVTIRSVLITVEMLHFVRRNPMVAEEEMWGHLQEVFGKNTVEMMGKIAQNTVKNIVKVDQNTVEMIDKVAKNVVEKIGMVASDDLEVKYPFIAEHEEREEMIEDDSKHQSCNGDNDVDEEEEEGDLFDSVCAICDNGGELLCKARFGGTTPSVQVVLSSLKHEAQLWTFAGACVLKDLGLGRDHDMDLDIGTPSRDHLKFPRIAKPVHSVKKKAKELAQKKRRTFDDSYFDEPVQKSSRRAVAKSSFEPVKKKAKYLKEIIGPGESLLECHVVANSPKQPVNKQEQELASLSLPTTGKTPRSSFPAVDSETEKRVIALVEKETSSLTLNDISRRCAIPSTYASSGRQLDKIIAQGKLERSVQITQTNDRVAAALNSEYHVPEAAALNSRR
ncbi:hypothetical protein PR202_gb29360 [Eleusine coracana subsp. coracana]|uniref:RFTS domain-containing protein n=1 Tax=Eleusine coracana subsp. coracana TaxID=191504 RepID=A0AAV5FYR9_ELECO|nr:hypothetical protein PR202_gb29360 [Eleusine coracana subsp. coracana]